MPPFESVYSRGGNNRARFVLFRLGRGAAHVAPRASRVKRVAECADTRNEAAAGSASRAMNVGTQRPQFAEHVSERRVSHSRPESSRTRCSNLPPSPIHKAWCQS